jgi:hypothetical protein
MNLVKQMVNDNQLDSLLKEMAADAAKSSAPQLPSAQQIWFRAEIQRKLRRRERIERPLVVMRGIAVAICLAAALLFAGELRPATGGSSVLSWLAIVVGFSAVAAIAAFLLAIWPAAKSKLQRR